MDSGDDDDDDDDDDGGSGGGGPHRQAGSHGEAGGEEGSAHPVNKQEDDVTSQTCGWTMPALHSALIQFAQSSRPALSNFLALWSNK